MGFETLEVWTVALGYRANFEAVPMGFETIKLNKLNQIYSNFEAVPMGFETILFKSVKISMIILKQSLWDLKHVDEVIISSKGISF